MGFLNTIKAKLIVLLVVIGMGPLIITMSFATYNAINSAFDSAENEMKVQTELIEKEVSALMGSNFTALRLLAVNPAVQEYLTVAPENRNSNMKNLVQNANALFNDASNIVITENSGQQLIRSDDSKLVNLSARDYFREAMNGRENVSEVIVSKTSGLAIVVIEVPVKNSDGSIIGMIQRNYNISALADLLRKESDSETKLAIFESNGKLVSHSELKIEKEEDRLDMSRMDFIRNAKIGERQVSEIILDGEKFLISYEREPQTNWIIATIRPYSVIESKAMNEALIWGISGVIIFLLIVVIANIVANKSVKPIMLIHDTADKIAGGDLSIKNISVESNDELGKVAHSFDLMTDKLNDFLHKARNSATTVAESAEMLNEHSRQSAEAANQIAEAVTNLAGETSGQQKATSAAQTAVNDLGELLSVIAKNSDDSAKASNVAIKTAEVGESTIANAVQSMKNLQSSVQESSQVIKLLGEESEKIGNIVETISGISAQTNLLALNAAIEAARAGEAGADEVRKLAEQSAQAADEIHKLISDVQNQTEKAVNAMGTSAAITQTSVDAVNNAGSAFREIVNHINGLTEKIDVTTNAIAKAESGNAQIIDSVHVIDNAAKKFTTQTETISSTTEQLSAATEEIASSSKQLADMAEFLQNGIKTFKLR